MIQGQTEARGEAGFDPVVDSADGEDFLARERAALGDDANQFATSNDRLATTVEDADDDLLGGGGGGAADGAEEIMGFESSFPAIDTTNEVISVTSFRNPPCISAVILRLEAN